MMERVGCNNLRRFVLFICLFVALIWVSPVKAQSIVNAANNQVAVAGTTGVTVTISTTLGNTNVLFAWQDASNSITETVTDSAGQTWTLWHKQVIGTSIGVMYYVANSAVLSSVKVTWSSASTTTMFAVVYQLSGVNAPDSDVSNPAVSGATGSLASLASGSLNTVDANCVLVYGVGEATTSNGWSDTVNGFAITSGGSSNSRRGAMAGKVVTTVQSGVTTTMSWSSAGTDRNGILAAFHQASAGGATHVFSKRDKIEKLMPLVMMLNGLIWRSNYLPTIFGEKFMPASGLHY